MVEDKKIFVVDKSWHSLEWKEDFQKWKNLESQQNE